MVLCIGLSERDRVYTWADLKPVKKHADLVAYEIARDAAEDKYRQWTGKVDDWIAKKQYDEMNEALDECKRLELNAMQMKKQMECDHPKECWEEIGQDVFVGGDFYHHEHWICGKCGKEFYNPKEK